MELHAFGCTRDLLGGCDCNGSGNDSYSAAEQGAVVLALFFMASASPQAAESRVGDCELALRLIYGIYMLNELRRRARLGVCGLELVVRERCQRGGRSGSRGEGSEMKDAGDEAVDEEVRPWQFSKGARRLQLLREPSRPLRRPSSELSTASGLRAISPSVDGALRASTHVGTGRAGSRTLGHSNARPSFR
jgi:hypothetical protein